MAKKPVTPGRKHAPKGKADKPSASKKKGVREKLVAKGVDEATAKHVTGEDEDLTSGEIAERRIVWQKNLPKA